MERCIIDPVDTTAGGTLEGTLGSIARSCERDMLSRRRHCGMFNEFLQAVVQSRMGLFGSRLSVLSGLQPFDRPGCDVVLLLSVASVDNVASPLQAPPLVPLPSSRPQYSPAAVSGLVHGALRSCLSAVPGVVCSRWLLNADGEVATAGNCGAVAPTMWPLTDIAPPPTGGSGSSYDTMLPSAVSPLGAAVGWCRHALTVRRSEALVRGALPSPCEDASLGEWMVWVAYASTLDERLLFHQCALASSVVAVQDDSPSSINPTRGGGDRDYGGRGGWILRFLSEQDACIAFAQGIHSGVNYASMSPVRNDGGQSSIEFGSLYDVESTSHGPPGGPLGGVDVMDEWMDTAATSSSPIRQSSRHRSVIHTTLVLLDAQGGGVWPPTSSMVAASIRKTPHHPMFLESYVVLVVAHDGAEHLTASSEQVWPNASTALPVALTTCADRRRTVLHRCLQQFLSSAHTSAPEVWYVALQMMRIWWDTGRHVHHVGAAGLQDLSGDLVALLCCYALQALATTVPDAIDGAEPTTSSGRLAGVTSAAEHVAMTSYRYVCYIASYFGGGQSPTQCTASGAKGTLFSWGSESAHVRLGEAISTTERHACCAAGATDSTYLVVRCDVPGCGSTPTTLLRVRWDSDGVQTLFRRFSQLSTAVSMQGLMDGSCQRCLLQIDTAARCRCAPCRTEGCHRLATTPGTLACARCHRRASAAMHQNHQWVRDALRLCEEQRLHLAQFALGALCCPAVYH